MATYVLVHAGWDGGWSWCQAAGYEYREASLVHRPLLDHLQEVAAILFSKSGE